MKRDKVIVIRKKNIVEVWGSLTEICRNHIDFDYKKIKLSKFPFKHMGWNFDKIKFRSLSNKNNT